MIEDPAKLFITRKRKKWKFAHFDDWPNCFQANEITPAHWQTPLVVEVGAGTADLTVALATHRPNDNFVAVDVKSDRLYRGAKFCLQHNITNVSFVRAHLMQLPRLFAPKSVKELWITFPDPFPRKRQAKHRLTHPQFLLLYKQILASDGILRFKTDNHELFLWSLEQFVHDGWRVRELSFDLHESGLPDEYKQTTYYERKFLAQGLPIHYVSVSMPNIPHVIEHTGEVQPVFLKQV